MAGQWAGLDPALWQLSGLIKAPLWPSQWRSSTHSSKMPQHELGMGAWRLKKIGEQSESLFMEVRGQRGVEEAYELSFSW